MKYVKQVLSLVDGKKTYISGVLIALYSVLKVFGVVNTTPEQDVAVYGLLASLLGVSLKHAISKGK